MKRAFLLAVLLAAAAHVIRAQQAGSNVNVLPVFTDASSLDEALVKGDLFLQRQVEPGVAVSTRNPDHLLAAFNDYRAVDFVEQDTGLGENEAGSEAWIGVSQSATGGATWSGSLLPGSPEDDSPDSLASPVRGMAAATDPGLFAAPCGRFYLAFLAFDRGGRSQLAVATFEDLNNREDAGGSIVYRGMSIVDTGSASAQGRFIDKPALIVDPARPASSADPCAHTVYVSYTTFTGGEKTGHGANAGEEKFNSQINIARSTDGGRSWTTKKVSQPYTAGQGTALAVDPRSGTPTSSGGGTLYVVWRSFDPQTILMVSSTDFGRSFTSPIAITGQTPAFPYDQPSIPRNTSWGDAGVAFRSNAFPTAAVADNGRLFVAWQERVNLSDCGAAPGPLCGAPDGTGSPRIVMVMSADGGRTWTDSLAAASSGGNGNGKGGKKPGLTAPVAPVRRAVDFARRDVSVPPSQIGLGLLPQERNSGPQVMPHLSFGGGRLMLVYYEARGQLGPTGYIDGMDRLMDLRAALLNPLTGQLLQPGSTTQVSQYPLKAYLQLDDLVAKGGETVDDVAAVNPPCRPDFGADPGLPECVRQVNRVNSTHSGAGEQAFLGDYIDLVASVAFVPDRVNGGWRWATAAADVPYVGYRTVFADDRHVLPPYDGNWSNYTPPGTGLPSCINPGSRNADVLTAQIDAGLVVSGPTTYKFLDIIPRAFPVQVSNRTGATAFYRIATAPDGRAASSFDARFVEDASADVDALDVIILPYSSVTRTLFVRQGATGSIRVDVTQITCVNPDPPVPGAPSCDPQPVPGGLTGSITYNLDATNPTPDDPTDDEVHNPLISNPLISNPLISNPLISNPLISNPLISNPLISNPLISNPLISNPLISNPLISNTTIYDIQDVTWTASNTGNTSTAYIALVNLVNAARLEAANPNNPDATGNYLFQLLIYRQSFSGSAGIDANGLCSSYNVPQDEVISVIQNPLISNPLISNPLISNPLISNPLISNATYALAPGDEVKITLRAFQLAPTAEIPLADQFHPDPNDPESLPDIVIASEAKNIEDGVVQPDPPTSLVIATASLPGGTLGQPYAAALASQGGTPPVFWSLASGMLPPGVFLNASTGILSGTATLAGSFTAALRVTDSGTPAQSFTRSFTIVIADSGLPSTNGAAYIVGPSNVIAGDVMSPPVVVEITDTTGAVLPGVPVQLSLVPSGTATLLGTTSGTTDAIGRVTFSDLRVSGGGVFSLLATPPGSPDGLSAAFTSTVPGPLTFVVTNTNDSGGGSLRQAILDSNAHGGFTNTINFSIPGPVPHVIAITSALPAVATPATIDATSEPGYLGSPVVELQWAGAPTADVTGFDVTAGGTTIKGFAIDRFGIVDPFSGGRAIWLHGGNGDIVTANYIGVDPTGGGTPAGRPGNHSGILVDTDLHQISSNVISANQDGIVVRGGTGTSITANTIGMDATALIPAGNTFPAISIYGGAANVYMVSNLISGNQNWGISIQGAGTGNTIKANTIGLDGNGDFVRLSPTDFIDGVTLINYGPQVRGNTMGGLLVADTPGVIVNGNVISGNTGTGLRFEGTDGGVPATVIANKIGTDPTGTLARGNVDDGIQIFTPGVVIGDATYATSTNVVSGNLSDGIAIVANDVQIVGNLIGTDATGTAALGNGQLSNPDPGCCHSGVYTDGNHTGIQVGGATAAEGNVIAGNFTGLWIGTAPGIQIRHNKIGVDVDGLNPVPNTSLGVGLFGTVGANVAENVVADNGGTGILTFFSASNNTLTRNQIHDNAGLGIDLGGDGVTANDSPESDGLQNYPQVTLALSSGISTQIGGTLQSAPSSSFSIEFFQSTTCDPSGNGEGEGYLTSATVNTGGTGAVAFNLTVTADLSGSFITATATDASGNTSEFSNCLLVTTTP